MEATLHLILLRLGEMASTVLCLEYVWQANGSTRGLHRCSHELNNPRPHKVTLVAKDLSLVPQIPSFHW